MSTSKNILSSQNLPVLGEISTPIFLAQTKKTRIVIIGSAGRVWVNCLLRWTVEVLQTSGIQLWIQVLHERDRRRFRALRQAQNFRWMKNLDMARCDSTFPRRFCLWFEWDIPIYKVHGSSDKNALKVFLESGTRAPLSRHVLRVFVCLNCMYTCSWNSRQCISISSIQITRPPKCLASISVLSPTAFLIDQAGASRWGPLSLRSSAPKLLPGGFVLILTPLYVWLKCVMLYPPGMEPVGEDHYV